MREPSAFAILALPSPRLFHVRFAQPCLEPGQSYKPTSPNAIRSSALILLINGREPAQNSVIRSRMTAKDIVLTNVTDAAITINGAAKGLIPTKDFSRTLLKIKDGEATVTLSNTSQANTIRF